MTDLTTVENLRATTTTAPVAANSDPAAIATAESARARIQAAYTVAIGRPRSYLQSRNRILERCKNPRFAELVEYAKPVGNTTITGPTIRFAELAIREWGNIDCQNSVVYEDGNIRRIRITITDLETNSTLSKEVQVSKTVERRSSVGREVIGTRTNSRGDTVYIVKATDDEIQMKTDSLVSKSIRNESLRLIPQEIVEEAIDVARETLRNRDAKDPAEARRKLADAFAALGVMPVQLESFLKHPLEYTSPDEMQELRTIYAAIKNGESKWSDFSAPAQTEPSEVAQDAKDKLERLKARRAAKDAETVSEPQPIQEAK